MQYYDAIICLGQWCAATEALRRNRLLGASMPFDWSAGILEDVCGKGGLEGKVNLICNDFAGFFNIEDFENRGVNSPQEPWNFWVVNKKTGLQYRYDFPASCSLEESFAEVKAKYVRRVQRLKHVLAHSKKVLFVYISPEEGFSNEYLMAQQEKISHKYTNMQCNFLYIMHNSACGVNDFTINNLNKHVRRIDINYSCSQTTEFPEFFYGNTNVYYPILKDNYASRATLQYLHEDAQMYMRNIGSIVHKLWGLACTYIKITCAKFMPHGM